MLVPFVFALNLGDRSGLPHRLNKGGWDSTLLSPGACDTHPCSASSTNASNQYAGSARTGLTCAPSKITRASFAERCQFSSPWRSSLLHSADLPVYRWECSGYGTGTGSSSMSFPLIAPNSGFWVVCASHSRYCRC